MALIPWAGDAWATFPGGNGHIFVTRWETDRDYESGYVNRVDPVTGKIDQTLSICRWAYNFSQPVPSDNTYCHQSGPAAFSPDGRTAAIIAQDLPTSCRCSLGEALRLRPLDGKPSLVPFLNPVDVSSANADGYVRVRWSPDGQQLLLDRPLTPAGGHAVYVAPVEDINQQRLVTEGSDADWSSDGRIVVVRRSNLYVGRIDGAFRRLTYRGGTQPSWSPRGRWLAFVRKHELYKVPSDGGRARRVARGDVHLPAWSPDGKQIAFLRAPYPPYGGPSFLTTIRAGGGKARRIGLDPSNTYTHGGYESERVYGPDWQVRPLTAASRTSGGRTPRR